MPSTRNDWRSAPPDKYGLPGVQYPAPDLSQQVIVVDFPCRGGAFEPLDYYTSHPDVAAAILTEQSPVRGDGNAINARRTYETLPGPWLYSTRNDAQYGNVQQKRRAVRTDPNAVSLRSPTGTTVYESRNGSAVVSWEVVEFWGDGSGTTGNPSYPIPPSSPEDDFEKGPIAVSTQLVPKGSPLNVASTTISGSTVTETTYEQFDEFHERKVIRTYTLPGPLRTFKKYDDLTQLNIIETRQLVAATSADPSFPSGLTDFQRIPVNDVVDRIITRTYPEAILGKTIVRGRPEHQVFPAIIHGLSGTISSGSDLLNYYVEAERPTAFTARHTITFQSTEPSFTDLDSGIVNLRPDRMNRSNNDGSLSVSEGPTLHDAFTLGTVSVLATVPSATDYLGHRSAGDYFIVQRVPDQIAQSLWSVTKIEYPYR